MKRFYLVWRGASSGPQYSTPRYRHADYNSARVEAKRLARDNPGDEFYVVEAQAVVISQVPEPTETMLLFPDPSGVEEPARADYDIVDNRPF